MISPTQHPLESQIDAARVIDRMMQAFADWGWGGGNPLGITASENTARDPDGIKSDLILTSIFNEAAEPDTARQQR